MERIVQKTSDARKESSRLYKFKASLRRIARNFTIRTNDPQFQIKLWFNYKDKINQIFVLKDINGDAKFCDTEQEFLNSNLSFDFGNIQMPKIDFQNDNKFVVLHELNIPKDLISRVVKWVSKWISKFESRIGPNLKKM